MNTDDGRFEDAIRASMRAHDHEAPVAADLPDILGDAQAEPDRRFTWVPLAAAAVVVAALVGTAIALNVGQDVGDPSAGLRVDGNNVLLCPKSYQTQKDERGPIWVPAKPNHVPAKHQLVPNENPAHAVVCQYVSERDGSPALSNARSGRKVLGGNLRAITKSLAAQPAGSAAGNVCFQYATSVDHLNYLIGLTYESGTLWVSAPGDHCSGASNGTFETSTNLRDFGAAAYAAGRWVSDPPALDPFPSSLTGSCAPAGTGRRGQAKQLVPGSPRSVSICVNGKARKTVPSAVASQLIRVLNGLDTRRVAPGCAGGVISGAMPRYDVIFTYPTGPGVDVAVTEAACAPITNGSLEAGPETAVRLQIAKLLR